MMFELMAAINENVLPYIFMDYYYVIAGLLVIGFASVACGGTRNWVRFDSFVCSLCGLLIAFFPDKILHLILVVKPDSLHSFLFALFGALLFMQSIIPILLNRNSSMDESVFQIHLYSKLVTFTVLLITFGRVFTGNSRLYGPKWNDNLKIVVGGYIPIALVCSTYFYATSICRNAYVDRSTWTNRFLRFDSFCFTILSVVFFCFQEKSTNFERRDLLHLSLARSCAAMLLGASFLSFRGPCLMFEIDKKQLLFSRVLGSGVGLLATISLIYRYDIYSIYVVYSTYALFLSFVYFIVVYVIACHFLSQLKLKAKSEMDSSLELSADSSSPSKSRRKLEDSREASPS